ncbi:hypothetical protein AAC387_Pa04g2223 [Persea americana]
MLLNLFNARLETLKPVPVREAKIDMRMKSLYRLWLMNGGSAVPIDLREWCGDLTVDIVVRMVVGKRCFDGSDHDGGDGGDGKKFQKAISQFFFLVWVFVVSDVIPLLKWFDFQGHRLAMKATTEELDSLLVKWLHEHCIKRSLRKGGDGGRISWT